MILSSNRLPRGYFGVEYPRPHLDEYEFDLNAEDETKNTTILPIIISDEGLSAPSALKVNPKNSGFAIATGPNCIPDSIVPSMSILIKCSLTKGAIETDAIRVLNLNYMPIYTAFLNRLDADDIQTTTDVEGLLELTHETTDKQAYPLWSGVDLGNATLMNANVPGLTTDQTIESVAFDKSTFFDAMHYYTNKDMLKVVTGRMSTIQLKRDRPVSIYKRGYNMPICKFMNPYTFCGIMFHLPQVGEFEQFGIASETTNIGHVHVGMKFRYNEWNKDFNQAAA